MFRDRPSRLKVFSRWMSASSCTLTEKGTSMTVSVRRVAVTTTSSKRWISERLGLFGVSACPCAEASTAPNTITNGKTARHFIALFKWACFFCMIGLPRGMFFQMCFYS